MAWLTGMEVNRAETSKDTIFLSKGTSRLWISAVLDVVLTVSGKESNDLY